MSDPFDIGPTLVGDALVAREITTKLARALTGGGRPVKVGEIEDDILKAIAAARSAALEEAAGEVERAYANAAMRELGAAAAAAVRRLKDP